MFHSIQALRNLALIESPEITGQITSNTAQTLDFGVSATWTAVFDFSLIAAFQTSINGKIESKIRYVYDRE